MNEKPHAPVPEAIQQLQQQLDQFRLTHPRRSKLPEPLWEAAAALARQYGIYTVAHPLRLDYVGLKKRLDGASSSARKAVRPTAAKAEFVELPAPRTPLIEECVIEFESARGGKMRIQWRAPAEPDWIKLLRAWRETEA